MLVEFETRFGPWFVIPMPLDKNGVGPAEKSETVITEWQVWDDLNNTVCSSPSRELAQLVVEHHNLYISRGSQDE